MHPLQLFHKCAGLVKPFSKKLKFIRDPAAVEQRRQWRDPPTALLLLAAAPAGASSCPALASHDVTMRSERSSCLSCSPLHRAVVTAGWGGRQRPKDAQHCGCTRGCARVLSSQPLGQRGAGSLSVQLHPVGSSPLACDHCLLWTGSSPCRVGPVMPLGVPLLPACGASPSFSHVGLRFYSGAFQLGLSISAGFEHLAGFEHFSWV
jgi:hypothetical protein